MAAILPEQALADLSLYLYSERWFESAKLVSGGPGRAAIIELDVSDLPSGEAFLRRNLSRWEGYAVRLRRASS